MLLRLFQSRGLLLAAAATLVSAAFVVPHWERDFYFDSAVFGGLARSLMEGEGYRFMERAHGKYPPGFPCLLALVQMLGLGLRGVHLVVGAGAVASIYLSYRLLAYRHGHWFAFGAASLTLVNHDFVGHQEHVLSDLPYLALSLATLLAARRLGQEGSWRWVCITALLGISAASIRGIGVALAPAIVLGLLLRRRAPDDPGPSPRSLAPQAAVAGLAILAFVGSWLLYGEAVNRASQEELLVTVPYHQELVREDAVDPARGWLDAGQVMDRFVFNTIRYVELTHEILDGRERHVGFPRWLAALLVVAGWGIAFWRRRDPMDWYVAAYMGTLSVWSGPEGTRFLLGLLPFLYHYLLVALAPWGLGAPSGRDGSDEPVDAWSPPRLWKSATALGTLSLVTVATSALPDYRALHGHLVGPYHSERVVEFQETLDWIVANVPEETPLVTDKAPMAHFVTGRLAYKFATVPDHEAVLASIAERGRPVVVVNDFHSNPRWLKPVIAAHPEHFREIHRIGGHVVYRFVPDPAAGDPAAGDPAAGDPEPEDPAPGA